MPCRGDLSLQDFKNGVAKCSECHLQSLSEVHNWKAVELHQVPDWISSTALLILHRLQAIAFTSPHLSFLTYKRQWSHYSPHTIDIVTMWINIFQGLEHAWLSVSARDMLTE